MIKLGSFKESESEPQFCLQLKCKNALYLSKNGAYVLKDLKKIEQNCLECKKTPSSDILKQPLDQSSNNKIDFNMQVNLELFKAAIVDYNGFNEDEIKALEEQIKKALRKGNITRYSQKNKES